jgi:fumarate reductase flavoprotein subunit
MQKDRTVATVQGPVVHLDLRHLGAKKIHERLPLITEVAKTFAGVDAVREPIPVCPAVHYTMGGILTNVRCETPLRGLYAAGECSSVGIHGANRLGSNSLVEILVFGHVAGESAAEFARSAALRRDDNVHQQAEASERRLLELLGCRNGERVATVRNRMTESMETGVGIYRQEATLRRTCEELAGLREQHRHGLRLDDTSRAFNTEWLTAIELGFSLEVAEAMAHAALNRRESRGAHMRLDGYETRDDRNFLSHSLAWHSGDGAPRIDFAPVTITRSAPRARVYGGAGRKAELS